MLQPQKTFITPKLKTDERQHSAKVCAGQRACGELKNEGMLRFQEGARVQRVLTGSLQIDGAEWINCCSVTV